MNRDELCYKVCKTINRGLQWHAPGPWQLHAAIHLLSLALVVYSWGALWGLLFLSIFFNIWVALIVFVFHKTQECIIKHEHSDKHLIVIPNDEMAWGVSTVECKDFEQIKEYFDARPDVTFITVNGYNIGLNEYTTMSYPIPEHVTANSIKFLAGDRIYAFEKIEEHGQVLWKISKDPVDEQEQKL